MVAEKKICDDKQGVNLEPKGEYPTIVDCATVCKAKLQNTMFAFETSKLCETSKKCKCYCIETPNKACTQINKEGFNLFSFRGSKMCKLSIVFRNDTEY